MSESSLQQCPVCNARFRQTPFCSRCGADLTPLMELVIRAWLLRNQARHHMLNNSYALALSCLENSLTLHNCLQARQLQQACLLYLSSKS